MRNIFNQITRKNYKSPLPLTDPRDAVPHVQCDKLVTDNRHQFVTLTHQFVTLTVYLS